MSDPIAEVLALAVDEVPDATREEAETFCRALAVLYGRHATDEDGRPVQLHMLDIADWLLVSESDEALPGFLRYLRGRREA